MGILGDAIAAFAQVSSGQSSAEEAVGSLGLSGSQHDRMVDLFEMEERSLRASGTLSADLNSVQSRERRALLDAQIEYHNDLQSHLESINDLNATNWNEAQDRWLKINESLAKRDAELAKARNNVSNSAIRTIEQGGTSTASQWSQLTGYLGIDGKALNDTQLYATLETWRTTGGNQNFLPSNWQTMSNEALRQHLDTQQLTDGQITSAMNTISRAKGTYSQIVIAEQQVIQTRAALDALQDGDGDFNSVATQEQLNNLRGQLDQMLVEGDPTTGLTAQGAIQAQGAMQTSFELLDEQEAFRERLNQVSPSERSNVNNGIAALLAKPEFQQWAKDNGIPIGISRDGRYVPRSTDHLAVLAFRREELRGMHRYGGSGGRTGEVLEIRVGDAPAQMYDVNGEMMTRVQAQAQFPGQTVTVNEAGQLVVTSTDDPGVDGLAPPQDRVFEKGPMTAAETVVVERARANAARIMDDPGKIEVFMPDGTIRVIDPDNVVQTLRDPSTEASLPEELRRDSRMRRGSRLWNRLVNSGLIDQLDDEDYLIDPDIDAGTMSRRDARRAERAAFHMTDAEREAQARLDSVDADLSTLPEEGPSGTDPGTYSDTLDVESTVQVDPETGEITYDEEAERARLSGIGLPDDVIDEIFRLKIDPSTIGTSEPSRIGSEVQEAVDERQVVDPRPPGEAEIGADFFRPSDVRRTTDQNGNALFLQIERDDDGVPTDQYLVYRGDPTTAEGSLEPLTTIPSSSDIEELFATTDQRPITTYTVSDTAAQRGDTVVYRTDVEGTDKVIELTDSGVIIYGDQVIEPGNPVHESLLQLVERDQAASTERQVFTTSTPMATDDEEVEPPPEPVSTAPTPVPVEEEQTVVKKQERQERRRDRRQSVLDMLRGRQDDMADPSIQIGGPPQDDPGVQRRVAAGSATTPGMAETLNIPAPGQDLTTVEGPSVVRQNVIREETAPAIAEIGAGLEGFAAGQDAGVFSTQEGADAGETREDRQSQRRLMKFIRGIGKGN